MKHLILRRAKITDIAPISTFRGNPEVSQHIEVLAFRLGENHQLITGELNRNVRGQSWENHFDTLVSAPDKTNRYVKKGPAFSEPL